jgi:uncharacterized repeat protein (TIGR02543 family)
MMATLLPTVALAGTPSQEATITLGTSALQRKDLLYYGTCTPNASLNQIPSFTTGNMAWYVISPEHTNATNPSATKIPNYQYNDNGGIFLLAKEPVYSCTYIGNRDSQYALDSTHGEIWYNSEIRAWLSGTFYGSAFSEKEKTAVRAVSTADLRPQTAYEMNAITIRSANLNQEKIFLLSYDEVTNPGFFDVVPGPRTEGVTDPVLSSSWLYFLRSSVYSPSCYEGSTYQNSALCLMMNGNWNAGMISQQLQEQEQMVGSPKGVRPAMNLTKSNILFCSKAVGGKPAGVVTSLSAPATESNVTDWKTTLLDSTKTLIIDSCTRKGNRVTVSYHGATTGANHYLSAVVTNSAGTEITYYGKVAALSDAANAAGSVAFDLDSKETKIEFFVEEDNGDYKTDYASQPQEVDIKVAPNITTTKLPDGVVGVDYRAYLACTGSNLTWTMPGTDNLLPSSLALDGATRCIHGTPNTAGTKTFTCTATNAYGSDSKTLSITIYPPANWTAEKSNAGGNYHLENARLLQSGSSIAAAVGDTITVIPDAGYQFTSLSLSTDLVITPGEVATNSFSKNGDGSYSFTMPDENVSVNATLICYTLSCASYENGTVTASYSVNSGTRVPITFGETIVPVGAAVTISATGNTDYRLDTRPYPLFTSSSYYEYSLSGVLNPTSPINSNPFTFTMPKSNVTLHPVFVKAEDVVTYTVIAPPNATLNNEKTVATVTGGTVTATYQKDARNLPKPVTFGETAIPVKTPVTVTFTPDEGYAMVPGHAEELTDATDAGCYYNMLSGNMQGKRYISASPVQISFPRELGVLFDTQYRIDLYAEFTSEPLPAPIISFTTQPQNAQMTAGATPGTLHAAAAVTPSGTAALHWYACDAQGAISGDSLGEGDVFTLPAGLAAGTYYYRCQASCDGAATVNSGVATVTVNAAPTPGSVAIPLFDPAPGSYSCAQNVTLSCTTEGAAIYYTTDGTEPTERSALYSAAIAVSSTMTVKAKAFVSDMTASETASAAYTIAPPAALGGTVTISGAAKYGAILTADPSGLTGNTGTLSYQWKRGGANIDGAVGSTYVLTQTDIGSTITVAVSSSIETGTITSTATATVEKADAPAAPAGLATTAVTAKGGHDGKISGTTAAMEYSTDASFSASVDCAADETTGLSANTYYLRIKETATAKAGAYTAITVADGPAALTCTVTVKGSYAAPSGAGSYASGVTVTIAAGTRSKYTFTGWTVESGSAALSNASDKTTTFTMPANNVVVTANWAYNGDAGGDKSRNNDESNGANDAPTEYAMIRGANATWSGASSGLTVSCSGEYAKFIDLWIDGAAIAHTDYTGRTGSTIITLNANYLKTLADGQHTVRFIFSDGYAQTTFTVCSATASPKTGDASQVMLWELLLAMSLCGMGMFGFAAYRKRKAVKRQIKKVGVMK